MAYQKLQAGRALLVVPSDTINIPNIAATARTGTTTSAATLSLIDTAGDFIAKRVMVGDIVYSGVIAAKVVEVTSATTLLVTTAIPSDDAYTIYSEKDNPSNGCVLYCGVSGELSVTTVGGDTVILEGVAAGSFIPIQVLRVNATVSGAPAGNIIALW